MKARSGGEKGFTLVEAVVAVLLLGLLMFALVSMFEHFVVAYQKEEKTGETLDNMRIVIDRLSWEIREATEIPSCGDGNGQANALLLKKEGVSDPVYYYYDPGKQVFYRKENSDPAQPLTNAGYIFNKPPFFEPYYEEGEIRGVKILLSGGYKGSEYDVSTAVYLRTTTD